MLTSETGYFVSARFEGAFNQASLRFEHDGDVLTVQVAIPMMGKVGALLSELRAVRKRYLACLPVIRVVEVINEVAKHWLQPDYHLRQLSERALPPITGLSRPMVSMLIDSMFGGLTRDLLWRLLVEELGDPLVLDGFRTRLAAGSLTRAYGPEVLVNIFGGGNPLVAALDMTYALLSKAAFVGRVSSHEPLFASLFAQSIAEVDEELAEAVVICWWPSEADEVGYEFLRRADCVVVSGTDTTVNAIYSMVPERQRVVSHSHRIGVGLIGREALDHERAAELARQAATDVSLVDQLTCLSPQVIYVEERGDLTPAHFAELLADELCHLQSTLPRGHVPLEAILSINRVKARYQFRQYGPESGATIFGIDNKSEWLVVYDPQPLLIPGPGYRSIRICNVENLDKAVDLIRKHKPLVSTVGLAVEDERLTTLAEQLGLSGVSRVCRIGSMLNPPLTWHHDGSFHLSPLLRWTDLELSS